MINIAVVTSNRAEYGILTPLLNRIEEDDELHLSLMVTGAHLAYKYGNTIEEIRKDGFDISEIIPILSDGDSAIDVSITMANAIKGFAEAFSKKKPDMLILLGDRTEMLGVAIAAMNENIAIAHIHGGEVTEGAVDDRVRHALTKLSFIHFAGTEIYRNRIIQMGEDPKRVFNVGTLSAENILNEPLMVEEEIRSDIGIPEDMKYVVVTLHPETIDSLSPSGMAEILCECMGVKKEFYYVITSSNPDVGGNMINDILMNFAASNENAIFIHSLGMKRYLSAVKYAAFALGNSSSGIVEAPVLGVPSINIGNRQRGRIMTETIVNVPFDKHAIIGAMDRAEKVDREPSTLYGNGDTSLRIVSIVKQVLGQRIDLKKSFYDLKEKP